MGKVGRNAPCPCGSGKKYKKCCLAKDEQEKIEQREQAKAEEKMGDTLQREKEKLFEPVESDEFPEDEYLDEEEEFDDEEADLADGDEEGGTGEEDDKDEGPQWPKVDIPQLKREVRELSEEENRIVDQWYEKYRELDDLDEKRAHLESFMESHPDLVDEMGLQDEALFEIICGLAEKDRHADAVDFLERLRREFPAIYKEIYGYLDLEMAAYKIATGKKNEIPACLENFVQYPDHAAGELFELIDLLQMTNCIEILEDFIPRVYVPVCVSPKIIGGDKILDTVVALCYAPFAKPDYTRKDVEKVSERLLSLEIPMNKDYCSPDSVEREFSKIFAPFSPWNMDARGNRKKLLEKYTDVVKNFQGYLHLRKGMDWTAANSGMQMAFAYLTGVVPKGKRPKTPFVFSKPLILETAAKFSKLFFTVSSTRFYGMLNAVFHFADYLGDTKTIPPDLRDNIKKWCMEIYEETFPKTKDQFKAVVFQRFPLDYR